MLDLWWWFCWQWCKVRAHCHITWKDWGSADRDCNISFRVNLKISVVFWNLQNYDSHLIMQELGKFSLLNSIIPNGWKKYMSFTINNKLSFIGSFQFLSSSLDSLVKSLTKNDFKYLSQEFDNKYMIAWVVLKNLRKINLHRKVV